MNQENLTYHYGLKSKIQALSLAHQVCNVLGHGSHGYATNLLLETAAAETSLGLYQDPTPGGAGMGLNQHDLIAFQDIISRTPMRLVKTIHMHFGYDIRKLVHTDLANDPLLSFIFCRLHYRLRPEPIPSSLRGRAEYWKQFYNSMAGKGTVTHYLDSANTYLYCLTPSDLSTPPCP
tara:strand:+ start:1810 stop:2340 length:531 start_codon:yes stop_codon:yes gene_type:complete